VCVCVRVRVYIQAIGYDADEAAGGTSAADKQSILAHAFVWCTV